MISVSIVIPCRNEEKFIAQCLDSLIANDYPKDKLEIIVVDGNSQDRTKEIINSYVQKYNFIKILDNPKKITPISMNVGIKNAKGDIISKTDAHTIYPVDYISKIINYFNEYPADAVGGIALAKPGKNTLTAKAIALVFTNSLGQGGSFRQLISKPTWSDTAFGCFYKKEVFQKIGLFNENLVRSQDMDFNLRLARAGGKILLTPVITYYFPKTSLIKFWQHNFKDGIWAIYPLKFGAPLFKLRHLMPLILASGLLFFLLLSLIFSPLFLIVLGFYFLISTIFSLKVSLKEKNIFLSLPFLLATFCRQIGYGLGSIWGLLKLILNK